MGLRALVKVMRAGNARTRLSAVRDGRSAVRLSMTAAALESGLLDALADGPLATLELAGRLDVTAREPRRIAPGEPLMAVLAEPRPH